MLAFLPVLPALTEGHRPTKPKLPVFKPRWWYRHDRLDARPVVWSLYNHPEEWGWKRYGDHIFSDDIIVHKPSKHEFYQFGMWSSNGCSCQQRRDFQKFQDGKYLRAYRWWVKNYGTPPVNEQFAAHFVHD